MILIKLTVWNTHPFRFGYLPLISDPAAKTNVAEHYKIYILV